MERRRRCQRCGCARSRYATSRERLCATCEAQPPCRVCKGRGYTTTLDEGRVKNVRCYRCRGTRKAPKSLLRPHGKGDRP